MNKRITSIVLSLVMLFTMLATAVPVLAATPVELKVTADTTSANPGDTINYKVSIGAVTDMGGLEFKLDIPSGLTVDDGSISIPDGLETIIDSDGPIIVPTRSNKYYWLYSAQLTGYTGTSDLVILTFSCKVDDGTTGTKTVSIKEVVLIDQSVEDMPFNVTGADVNVTIPHAHVYDQTSTDAAHLKTPATCTEAAVYYKSCTCGENGTETFTSGSALGHDYTKKVENNTYLKTAASNCTEYNVYWYACSRCDANAKDDAAATDKYYTSTTAGEHSFTEKIEDAAHYVAGTGTDCQSVKKYYFDCAYCDQIGTTTWDSTTYGPHDYATTWSSDASGHWHECSLCHDKKDEAAHTPGAAATETTPQKCTECDYIITPALGHTHHMTLVDENPATCTTPGNKAYYVCSGCSKWFEDATGSVEISDHSSVVISALGHDYTKKVENDTYLKTAASNCTEYNVYWYACSRCDANAKDDAAATDKYYTSTTAGEHSYAATWSSDADGHWHECSLCHDKKDKAAHTPGAAATETTPQKCTECDYIITPALGHTHSYSTDWKTDTDKHWHECSCGDKSEEAAHTASDWITDTAATATTDGTKHKECTVCKRVLETGTIPTTGYTITFDANGGSVTPASAETTAEGKLTSLPTPTRSGSYSFKGWYTAASSGTKITTDTVFSENTTLYAQWTYTGGGGGGGVSKYTVKFETNGGSTIANKTVTRNTVLAESTAPTKDGYTFAGWYSDKELKTAYDFSAKVTKSFTLYAKWTEKETEPDKPTEPVEPTEPTAPEWKNPFTDVKKSDWFYTNVEYAVNNKLMNGTTATTFAPNEPLTRGMLVAILYRAEGEPAVNKSIPFSDVDTSAYYANAVIWAQQNGIVNGVTENEFAPNSNITREQIAAIMHRYAKYKGYDVSVGENTNILSYTDAESISEYAISAMQYAVGSGLMKGKTETSINPQDNATRAEIAAILQRFIEANK